MRKFCDLLFDIAQNECIINKINITFICVFRGNICPIYWESPY